MKSKLFKFSAFIVFILAIASCTRTNQERLQGNWTATSIHVNSIDVMNTAPYFTNVKASIQSNHTFIASSDYDTTTGTWQATDAQLTVYMPTDTFIYDYTLVDDNHLNMSTTIFSNFSEYSFSK